MFWRKKKPVSAAVRVERVIPEPTLESRRVVVLSTRADGSVLKGYRLPFAEKLYAAGTPPMWGLAKTPAPSAGVAAVKIGDRLRVERAGNAWCVYRNEEHLGVCRWRAADEGREDQRRGFTIHYPQVGELTVTQVLSRDGVVVDFGGIVTSV